MFKTAQKRRSSANEEELLQRAMGRLYWDARVRETIRQRLGNQNIATMGEAELYELVADLIEEVTHDRGQ